MLILVLTVIGYVSISAFGLLVCVPADITCSAVGIKTCAITAGIKKCISIIKKKKNKNDKIVLLRKTKLDTTNCFCGIGDRQNTFSVISGQDHFQRYSPPWISLTPHAGLEPMRNLSSDSVKWSCVVVITKTPQRYVIATTTRRHMKF